jgi:transglycosylase-like protein with SLT domain
MKSGRSLVLLILALSLITPQGAQAVGFIDPFLEGFQVGQYQTLTATDLDQHGWPRELFQEATVEEAARTAWPDLLTALQAHDTRCLSWRFPGLGSLEWTSSDSTIILSDKEMAKYNVMSRYRSGAYAEALSLIDGILAISHNVPASEVFVWSLRRRALESLLTPGMPIDTEFWPEMLDLGSFDKQSGWSIWSARQKARQADLLPVAATSRRDALWLMGVRKPAIDGKTLDQSAFADDLKSALGAEIHKKSELRRHFGLYPQPPVDRRLQAAWLSGKWQLGGRSSQQALKLAERTDIAPANRAQYYRRAAERLALAGAWQSSRDAFALALDYSSHEDAASIRRRVTVELERAATLAAHRGHATWAARLEDLNPLIRPVSANPVIAGFEAAVDRGEAPLIDGAHLPQAPQMLQSRLRLRLLRIWAEWGLTLLEDGEGHALRDYVAGLRVLSEGEDPNLLNTAATAIAGQLGRSANSQALGTWMIWQDLSTISGQKVTARISPIPKLLQTSHRGSQKAILNNHALLGLAIIYGDGRGQMAAAQMFSTKGLSRDDHLLLMYPVPQQMDLLATIAAAGLEPELVLALIRNESRFDPGARSRAGALGWMQIMPFHFPDSGFSAGQPVWRHPAPALQKGLSIIRENMRRYRNDPYRVLAAYNAGPTAVGRWDRQLGGDVDRSTFLSWIGYPETRGYVRKVLIDRMVYARILDGVETTSSETGEQ